MNDGEAALELYRNRGKTRDELETWIFELLTEPGYDEGFKAGKEEQEEGYDEGYRTGRVDLAIECGADGVDDLKIRARPCAKCSAPPAPPTSLAERKKKAGIKA